MTVSFRAFALPEAFNRAENGLPMSHNVRRRRPLRATATSFEGITLDGGFLQGVIRP